jgi:hypothetical protein
VHVFSLNEALILPKLSSANARREKARDYLLYWHFDDGHHATITTENEPIKYRQSGIETPSEIQTPEILSSDWWRVTD